MFFVYSFMFLHLCFAYFDILFIMLVLFIIILYLLFYSRLSIYMFVSY